MNAFASTSTAPRAPHHSRASSPGSHNLVWDLIGSPMYPIGQEQLQYDARGRLLPFVETNAQKRERERLLKRKEHAKRVNKWLEESSMEAAKMNTNGMRSTPSPVAGRRFHLGDRPDSIAEEDEEEPYILYSTSPSSSPYNTSPLSLPSSSFGPSVPTGFEETGSLKSSSRRSSRSSLGSIAEEDAGPEEGTCP